MNKERDKIDFIERNFSPDNSMLEFIKKEKKKNNFRNNISEFMELLQEKNYDKLIILLKSLDDNTYLDAYGNTPLILGSKYNMPHEYLTKIINLNININASNYDGERAFDFIKDFNDAKYFISHDVDIDYLDKNKNHIIFTLLTKNVELKTFILLSEKLNYSSLYDINGNTLLDIELTQLARVEFINFFIELGIDVKNVSNKTNVLIKLIKNLSKKNQLRTFEHIFSLLLQHGANPNFVYEINDDIHIPVISYIASLSDNYINLIKVLISYGSKHKALSSTHKTPIDYARAANNLKILRYLQKLDKPLIVKFLTRFLFKKPLAINYPLKIIDLKNVFLSNSNKVSEELYKSVLDELRDIKYNIKFFYSEPGNFNLGEYEFYLQKARERNFPLMLRQMKNNSELINFNEMTLLGATSGHKYDLNDKIKCLISICFEENEVLRKEYLEAYLYLITHETNVIESIIKFSNDNQFIQALKSEININYSLKEFIGFEVNYGSNLLGILQKSAEFDTIREEFSLIDTFISKFYDLEPVCNLLGISELNVTDNFWKKIRYKIKIIGNNVLATQKNMFQLNYAIKEAHVNMLKEMGIYTHFQILKLEWKAFLNNNFIIIENEEIQDEANISESEFELLSQLSDNQLHAKNINSADVIRTFLSNGEYLEKIVNKSIKIDHYLKKAKKIPVYTKYIMYTDAGIPTCKSDIDTMKIKSFLENDDNLIAFLLVTDVFSKHVAFYCFGEETNIDIINKYYDVSY